MFRSLSIALAIVSIFSLEAKKKVKLQVGSQAPEFSCMGDDGKTHNLSDYRGKIVVLFFYPMDGSPWCTQEAQGFKDNFKLFEDNDIVVLGISCDSVKDHKKFKEKYNLPFTLLSDPKSKVFKLYGLKGMLFNSRVTYVIDGGGKILEIFSNIETKTHAQDVLESLDIKDSVPSNKTCSIK
jgi:peroxiredoxin Q/BCP